jgi:hypothetical protein
MRELRLLLCEGGGEYGDGAEGNAGGAVEGMVWEEVVLLEGIFVVWLRFVRVCLNFVSKGDGIEASMRRCVQCVVCCWWVGGFAAWGGVFWGTWDFGTQQRFGFTLDIESFVILCGC